MLGTTLTANIERSSEQGPVYSRRESLASGWRATEKGLARGNTGSHSGVGVGFFRWCDFVNNLGGPGSSSAGVVWMAKDAGNKMQKGRVVELDGFDF